MGAVLVIDDEKLIRDLLQQVLHVLDHTVDTAETGAIGMKKFDQGAYDLVITDVRMPEADGHSVVHHIRQSKRQHTPVIGVSGTPWLLQNSEFDRVLQKPFAVRTLMEEVTHLTQERIAS
jgi:CheY-like chemotaxis protein